MKWGGQRGTLGGKCGFRMNLNLVKAIYYGFNPGETKREKRRKNGTEN
jgi:hypothetical protein